MERAFTAAKKFVHDTAKAAHEAVVPARSRSAFRCGAARFAGKLARRTL